MDQARATGRTEPGIGVLLPTVDPTGEGLPPVAECAATAEALGFDSVWVGDHLVFHCPYLEALTTLSAAGAATSTVSLGTGVLLLPLRHLTWTVKQLTSLQVLHGDRLVLGVGLGGEGAQEWEAAGVDRATRGARLTAQLAELADALGGRAFVDGERTVPPLLPHGAPPPVWVGGRSDAALQRAATYGDGHLALFMDPEGLRRARRRLDELAEHRGRQPVRLGLNVLVWVDDDPTAAARAAATYVEGVFQMPYARAMPYAAVGTHDQVVASLRALRDAGAESMVFLPAGPAPAYRDQLVRLAQVRADVIGVG